jgi:hypothetical protein
VDGAVRPHRQGHDPRPHLLPPADWRLRQPGTETGSCYDVQNGGFYQCCVKVDHFSVLLRILFLKNIEELLITRTYQFFVQV